MRNVIRRRRSEVAGVLEERGRKARARHKGGREAEWERRGKSKEGR